MKKKAGFLVAGILLAGVLIYFLSFGTSPEQQPLVSNKSVLPVSGNQPVAAERFRPAASASPQETAVPVPAAGNVPAGSAALQPARAQVPELEPEIREALGDILNTSSEGLVEKTRNGVTSVDLQGHFQNAPVATVDEEGNIQITDYSHRPKASTQP